MGGMKLLIVYRRGMGGIGGTWGFRLLIGGVWSFGLFIGGVRGACRGYGALDCLSTRYGEVWGI